MAEADATFSYYDCFAWLHVITITITCPINFEIATAQNKMVQCVVYVFLPNNPLQTLKFLFLHNIKKKLIPRDVPESWDSSSNFWNSIDFLQLAKEVFSIL